MPNDYIVTATSDALSMISAAGGDPETLIELEAGEQAYSDPQALPNGKAVLFVVVVDNEPHIEVYVFETEERRFLIDGNSPRYAASGHLVFERSGSLWAAPFDQERLEIQGDAVPVLEDIQVSGTTRLGVARFDIAANGTLVYVPRGSFGASRFVWVDPEGNASPAFDEVHNFRFPRLALDGTRVAVVETSERFQGHIWIYDLTRGTRTRLTLEGMNDYPVWSSDGSRIAFSSDRAGARNLYSKLSDGTGETELCWKAYSCRHHGHATS